jgi:hypothetical protein
MRSSTMLICCGELVRPESVVPKVPCNKQGRSDAAITVGIWKGTLHKGKKPPDVVQAIGGLRRRKRLLLIGPRQ